MPAQATAPALILVGIMMLASFKDINWTDLEDAIPAFLLQFSWDYVIASLMGLLLGSSLCSGESSQRKSQRSFTNYLGH